MAFSGLNLLAVFVAALASWIAGAIWYTALARPWLVALGKTRAELMGPSGKPSPVPFFISFVAELIMAWILAGLIGHVAPGGATVMIGVISGFFAWFGFVLTTLATNHAFGGQRPMLTLIDGLHWLIVLLVQGAIIGAFNV